NLLCFDGAAHRWQVADDAKVRQEHGEAMWIGGFPNFELLEVRGEANEADDYFAARMFSGDLVERAFGDHETERSAGSFGHRDAIRIFLCLAPEFWKSHGADGDCFAESFAQAANAGFFLSANFFGEIFLLRERVGHDERALAGEFFGQI